MEVFVCGSAVGQQQDSESVKMFKPGEKCITKDVKNEIYRMGCI